MRHKSVQRFCGKDMRKIKDPEQLQEKCRTVFRRELCKNKGIERFRDSKKSGKAPEREKRS